MSQENGKLEELRKRVQKIKVDGIAALILGSIDAWGIDPISAIHACRVVHEKLEERLGFKVIVESKGE